MAGVLDGVRVIEVSTWAALPGAGAILSDWGADVTKVEDIASGSIDFEKEAVKQAWEQLSAMSAEYEIKAEDATVRLGSPAVEIRTLADELGADLIVIGTHCLFQPRHAAR